MIAARLEKIRREILEAAHRSGRSGIDVCLIGVSKTQPPSMLSEALAAGLENLGENRVQEAAGKKSDVHGEARWHLIGPLQRNKAKKALEIFDVIHTLDRPELVERLQFLLEEHWPGRSLPVLLQVNIGREGQKTGVRPEDLGLLGQEICRNAPALRPIGLMCIPPQGEDPEAGRPFFRNLRKLRDDLEQLLGQSLPELSMGMSADFGIAIEEGATMVRVGSALFGPRGRWPR